MTTLRMITIARCGLFRAAFETLGQRGDFVNRFRVVADEWTLETGELTPSRKLKRRVITAQYAELIAALYVDEATSRGE